jgi:hypothetical protein
MYPAGDVFVRNMTDEPSSAPTTLRDSVGLEYSLRGGEIYVSYPPAYGAAFPIGDYPSSYDTAPPNAITRERVAIWHALAELAAQAATAAPER